MVVKNTSARDSLIALRPQSGTCDTFSTTFGCRRNILSCWWMGCCFGMLLQEADSHPQVPDGTATACVASMGYHKNQAMHRCRDDDDDVSVSIMESSMLLVYR
jgi:hypothetical protein